MWSGDQEQSTHTSRIFPKAEGRDNRVMGKLMEKRRVESCGDRNKKKRGQSDAGLSSAGGGGGGRGSGEIDGRRRRRYGETGVKGAGGGSGAGSGMRWGGGLLPAADGSQSQ